MKNNLKQNSNAKKILKIYWQHAKRYKMRIVGIYSTMVIAQILEDFIQPVIVSIVITKLAQGDVNGLREMNIPLILTGILATELASHILWNRFIIPRFWKTEEKIMYDLTMTSFDHLQKMSTGFFNDRFAGSLVSQVNKFTSSFERLVDAFTFNIFKLMIAMVISVIILAPKAPIVSITIISVSAIYIPLVWIFRQRLLPYNTKWSEAENARTGQLADVISNILAVKSFAGESNERSIMQTKAMNVYDRSISTMHLLLKQEFITGLLQRSINVIVIIASILLALNGSIEVGIIYLSLTFTMTLMRRLWDLNSTFRTFTRVIGDAREMAEILHIDPSIQDKNLAFKKPFDSSIEFNDVVFAHDQEALLFKNLNLHIKPGERIGLIGKSGSGKTTLTKLLLRFQDINSGAIKIGGTSISDMPQQELRSLIAYVPQEPLLFHRSLAENIAYAKPTATRKEIKKSAYLAHASLFIDQMPEKYDTLVGERGVKLSGGQKQRVAIARAILKDAPILILDEATSALDSESESLIQDSLWKLMEGRTAIVIAHRLSTIQQMDRIIVLDKGRIIEDGPHKELLAKNGVYSKLWRHQSGGFIEE